MQDKSVRRTAEDSAKAVLRHRLMDVSDEAVEVIVGITLDAVFARIEDELHRTEAENGPV